MDLTNHTTFALRQLATTAVTTKNVALGMAVSAELHKRHYADYTLYRDMWSGDCATHGLLWLGNVQLRCPFCGSDLVPF